MDTTELLEATLTEVPWAQATLKETIAHNAACSVIKELFKSRTCCNLDKAAAVGSTGGQASAVLPKCNLVSVFPAQQNNGNRLWTVQPHKLTQVIRTRP